MTPQQLKKIAENYNNENILPDSSLTQYDLIVGILQAIELAEKEIHWSYQIHWLIVIAACARAIELNYGKFAESNIGIPWRAMGEMVQHLQLRYKLTHGLGGHIFSEGSYQNLNLHRETIKAVVQGDFPHLKLVLIQIRHSKFFRQILPVATKIQKICNFYTEESQLNLLREIAHLLTRIKFATSEDRIFILRQIAIIGEAFVQLSDETKAKFDENFIKACKVIRDTLDHAEAAFNKLERDLRIRKLLNEITDYIETGNKQSNLKDYLWYIFRPYALTATKQSSQQLLENNYGYHKEKIAVHSYQNPNDKTAAGIYIPKRASLILYEKEIEKSKLPSPSLILQEAYMMDHIQSSNSQLSGSEDAISKIQYLFKKREEYEAIKKIAQEGRLTEHKDFLNIYEKIKKELFQIEKIERKNKNGEVVKVDIIYLGILNCRTKESQIENTDGIEERWHYLYLFQSIYYQTKEKVALSSEEQELIEQYESVESSYKKKIWDLCNPLLTIDGRPRSVSNHPKIEIQQKRKFLQAFLELYLTEYILINQLFHDSWYNLIDDTLNNSQLDFLKLYNNIQQNCSKIKIIITSSSSNRYEQMEQAYQLLSHLILNIEKIAEVKLRIEALNLPHSSKDADSLQILNTYQQGINFLRSISGEHFIFTEISDQNIKEFSHFLEKQPETVKQYIADFKKADFKRKVLDKYKNFSMNEATVDTAMLPNFDYATFKPIKNVVFRNDTLEEKQIATFRSKQYHSIREYYQIIAGSYVRALKENSVFMQDASEKLLSILDYYGRAVRGYMAHNTAPRLGAGEEKNIHSATGFHSAITNMQSILLDLRKLQERYKDILTAPDRAKSHDYSSLAFFRSVNCIQACIRAIDHTVENKP